MNSSLGGNVTVSFSGGQVEVYDNIAKAILTKGAFKSTDAITVDLPAGQANRVSVVLPAGANAAIPKEVLIEGVSGATNNQVTVVGTGGANSFSLAGNTVTANGLATQITAVQKLMLDGGGGNDYFTLTSSAVPTAIVDTGGYNTADFSHDTAGVTVNLGLDQGQSQSIAPWGTTLSISGVINKLIGTAYADTLTGGPAAVTEIVGGLGNDTLIGGSGNNILLGGGGNDTIIGGLGRNLMIAGSGTCSLYTNGWQNMVFAGSTNYDANDQALLNLLAQGPQVSTSYGVRRADRGGQESGIATADAFFPRQRRARQDFRPQQHQQLARAWKVRHGDRLAEERGVAIVATGRALAGLGIAYRQHESHAGGQVVEVLA